jgi:hypothetical protein
MGMQHCSKVQVLLQEAVYQGDLTKDLESHAQQLSISKIDDGHTPLRCKSLDHAWYCLFLGCGEQHTPAPSIGPRQMNAVLAAQPIEPSSMKCGRYKR